MQRRPKRTRNLVSPTVERHWRHTFKNSNSRRPSRPNERRGNRMKFGVTITITRDNSGTNDANKKLRNNHLLSISYPRRHSPKPILKYTPRKDLEETVVCKWAKVVREGPIKASSAACSRGGTVYRRRIVWGTIQRDKWSAQTFN